MLIKPKCIKCIISRRSIYFYLYNLRYTVYVLPVVSIIFKSNAKKIRKIHQLYFAVDIAVDDVPMCTICVDDVAVSDVNALYSM